MSRTGMRIGRYASAVMGPGSEMETTSTFFDGKKPPKWNGTGRNYDAWKEDICLWNELTDLAEKERAIGVIGKLEGEPRNLARTLKPAELGADDGLKKLLKLLDKPFSVSSEDRIDEYLMDLFNLAIEDKTLDHLVSGFIKRVERITESPTLCPIPATIYLPNNILEFAVELKPYEAKIIPSGNHMYLSHAKLTLAEKNFFNDELDYVIPRYTKSQEGREGLTSQG